MVCVTTTLACSGFCDCKPKVFPRSLEHLYFGSLRLDWKYCSPGLIEIMKRLLHRNIPPVARRSSQCHRVATLRPHARSEVQPSASNIICRNSSRTAPLLVAFESTEVATRRVLRRTWRVIGMPKPSRRRCEFSRSVTRKHALNGDVLSCGGSLISWSCVSVYGTRKGDVHSSECHMNALSLVPSHATTKSLLPSEHSNGSGLAWGSISFRALDICSSRSHSSTLAFTFIYARIHLLLRPLSR